MSRGNCPEDTSAGESSRLICVSRVGRCQTPSRGQPQRVMDPNLKVGSTLRLRSLRRTSAYTPASSGALSQLTGTCGVCESPLPDSTYPDRNFKVQVAICAPLPSHPEHLLPHARTAPCTMSVLLIFHKPLPAEVMYKQISGSKSELMYLARSSFHEDERSLSWSLPVQL